MAAGTVDGAGPALPVWNSRSYGEKLVSQLFLLLGSFGPGIPNGLSNAFCPCGPVDQFIRIGSTMVSAAKAPVTPVVTPSLVGKPRGRAFGSSAAGFPPVRTGPPGAPGCSRGLP